MLTTTCPSTLRRPRSSLWTTSRPSVATRTPLSTSISQTLSMEVERHHQGHLSPQLETAHSSSTCQALREHLLPCQQAKDKLFPLGIQHTKLLTTLLIPHPVHLHIILFALLSSMPYIPVARFMNMPFLTHSTPLSSTSCSLPFCTSG